MQDFINRQFSLKSNLPIFMVAAALVISGCAQQVKSNVKEAPEGKSSYKTIMPNNAAQYELTEGQTYNPPNLTRRVDPVYPHELINGGLKPVDIMAQVIVNEMGHVTDVQFAKYLGDITNRDKFEQSIRDAVSNWEYSPLTFATTQVDSSGKKTVVTQAKPFSLWYMFHFEIKNGAPVSGVVESDDSSSAN